MASCVPDEPAQIIVPLKVGLHDEIRSFRNPAMVVQWATVGATITDGVVDVHSSGGRIVGELLGVAVGEALGRADGRAVGDNVGSAVGAALGISVGNAVGVAVGLNVTNSAKTLKLV